LDAESWPTPSIATRALSRLVNPGGAPSAEALRAAVVGQTVLVTGASYGIGEAVARRLAGAGARVLLVARSADRLEQLAGELRAGGGAAEAWPADLCDPDAVAALARSLLEANGAVDVIVNNAGKSIRRSLALSFGRPHDAERTMGVNYLGPVRLLLALLPEMCARRRGHVVNVSTIGVRIAPGPRWGAYQASKAAFDIWLRSVAPELELEGVATTSIYMALVYTRMSAPTPSLRRAPGLTPDQAAGLVARAIVTRRRTLAPWWLLPAELLSVGLRGPLALALRLAVRRSADTESARRIAQEFPR
jgi:short-subunit dehydrogenase